ncbi:MAG: hypothetical protein L0027_14940 [Candidatus Rokubacteria bacterium]|nr:hypothetical protein [Candidatus Rokubacteria bacterium]
MATTLILTAAEREARALARGLGLAWRPGSPFPAYGRDGAHPARLAPVGLRAELIAARWAALLDGLGRPVVISAGVCGGLAGGLAWGDLVLPAQVLGPGGDALPVTSPLRSLALARAGGRAQAGSIATSREVIHTPAGKAALQARTGAVAVDMESSVILAAAAAAGCPSLVVRGVSDIATEALPAELTDLLTSSGRLRALRAVGAALRHPRVARQALALRAHARRALDAVAAVLRTVLDA